MHAVSSYRGNRPTNTQTNPRQDRLQYAAPQLACSVPMCVIKLRLKLALRNACKTAWLRVGGGMYVWGVCVCVIDRVCNINSINICSIVKWLLKLHFNEITALFIDYRYCRSY